MLSPVITKMGDCSSDIPSWYVTSHSDQLSLLSYSIGQKAVAVLSGWEGNRRFGVTLAMLAGLRERDKHPAYNPEQYVSLYLSMCIPNLTKGCKTSYKSW